MSNIDIRGGLKLVRVLVVLLIAGCSAGGTGNDFQTPPASDFSFAQTSGVQVAENVRKTLQLVWVSNGSPVSGQTVTLSISQGQLIDSAGNLGASVTVSTQSDGTVSVDALSSTAGTATVTATAKDPTSGAQMTTTLSLNFVGPPSKITVQAPSPIPVNGTSLITAVVADADGNVLEGVTVNFSIPATPAGGTLSSATALTDKTGTAHSLFTADGKVSSVMVNVDAPPAATQSATIQVTPRSPQVATLTFSACPTSMPSGSTVTCTLTLLGSDGKGIPNTAVTVTAKVGSVAPPTGSSSLTTGADGTVQFVYTASSQSQSQAQAVQAEVLTASAQVNGANITKTLNLELTPVTFSFTPLAAGAQVVTNVRKALVFTWTSELNPISNQPVTISTTQGQLIDSDGNIGSTLTVSTGTDGTIPVETLSSTTGAATITATAEDSTSGAQLTATLALNFVGPPSTVTVQAASPIAVNGTSLVTAVVDDASSNALDGIAVNFSIPSGGTLSAASTTTDSSGIARTLFTPDGTSSSVTVQATAPPLAPQTTTIQVTLVGSPPPSATLTFSSCPASIPAGGAITCTLSLIDGNGQGVPNTVINLTASIGSVATTTGGAGFTTGADGTVRFVYTAMSGSHTPLQGQTVLTASTQVGGTNITQTFNLTLDPAEFGFTQPASSSQQTINVRKTLVLKWTSNGQPVPSVPVAFSTNLGVFIDSNNSLFTNLTENTGADGIATGFDILSTTTGPITVTAQATDPVSAAVLAATLQFNFVGPPSSFTLNAPSPIPANGTSLIRVVVIDANGTKLSGIAVRFALDAGTPGGTLSATSVNTDTSGTASAIFTPDGSATSATVTVTVSPLSAQTATIQIGS